MNRMFEVTKITEDNIYYGRVYTAESEREYVANERKFLGRNSEQLVERVK